MVPLVEGVAVFTDLDWWVELGQHCLGIGLRAHSSLELGQVRLQHFV